MSSSPLLTPRFAKNFWPIPATNQFKLGKPAPDFELPEVTTDRPIKLFDLVGDPANSRPVLLYFTRIFTESYYCPLCFPHLQALNQAYDQFVAQGAIVLMITSTDRAQSQVVQRDLSLKMPLLSDPACRVFRTYGVGQALGAPLPAQFWIDRPGRVQFRHLFSFLEPNASIDRLLTVLAGLR